MTGPPTTHASPATKVAKSDERMIPNVTDCIFGDGLAVCSCGLCRISSAQHYHQKPTCILICHLESSRKPVFCCFNDRFDGRSCLELGLSPVFHHIFMLLSACSERYRLPLRESLDSYIYACTPPARYRTLRDYRYHSPRSLENQALVICCIFPVLVCTAHVW